MKPVATRYLLPLIGLVALYLLAVWIRLYVLDQQYQRAGQELPFTLESALQYRMTKIVTETGNLPTADAKVQWPEGVNLRETYTIGAEYLYAALAAILPQHRSLQHRYRQASVLLFCLGVPALALFAGLTFRSRLAGGVAGAYYAVAMSSVIRSNGLELSRENLGLPLMCIFLACIAWNRLPVRGKTFWISATGAALSLAAALCFWDMTQYFIGLWILTETFRCITRTEPNLSAARCISLITLTLLLAACLNPYLRAHHFATSPLFGLILGLACAHWLPTRIPPLARAAILLLPPLLLFLLASDYGSTYGHFWDLLKAKIAFANVKPLDPALLNFNQRIMWTPQLNSATWNITYMFFRFSLFLAFTGAILILLLGKRVLRRAHFDLVVYFFVTALAYWLFVRFQAYLAIFLSLCIAGGMLIAFRLESKASRIISSVLLVLLGYMTEIELAIAGPGPDPQGKARYWVRPHLDYAINQEVIEWFQQHGEQQPVVANFGLSASLLAYAECPIVLHPKFEGREIRNRVETYGRHLFHYTEEELRNWVNQHQGHFLVFSRGELGPKGITQRMRYMVDAVKPNENCAARLFHHKPNAPIWFTRRWSNRQYTVYQVVSEEDQASANDLVAIALIAYGRNELDKAAYYADLAGDFWLKSPQRIKIINAVATQRMEEAAAAEHQP